jgi:signal transduction histidine kinase
VLKVKSSGFSSPSADEVRENQLQRALIVGQLAGGILHDFNNILTVVTGTIEILAEAVADRPELAAIANLIDQAATRGATLTSSLLAFARDQPSQRSEIDVNAVIEQAARLLRATLGVQIEIVLTLADDVPPALADPGQLTAALLSLAIAARDAMPEGGRLSFRTAVVRAAPAIAAAPGAVKCEDTIVIAVAARGEKIAGEGRGRIILDLGLAADFAGRSGGHIEIDHQAGDGARVEVSLPIA